MFTQADFKRLNRSHFDVLLTTGYHIILRSKSTKHLWDLECRELFAGKPTIVVFHKHHPEDMFHVQKGFNCNTVLQAQKKIYAHDAWHKAGRQKSANLCVREMEPCL